MRVIKGIDTLLKEYKALPDTGWLFIDEDFDVVSKNDILNKNYYLAQDDDEEEEMEDSHSTFLESPTFKDIVVNKLNHNPKATRDEIIEAIVHYLENDEFLD
ncbi:DUF7716 domain-containing protein [Erwinia billingiae]|uniref:DUF7716 domain-containing protein n=1 Tax=Erwinia billingiae TaxID=182337 RepID=UPI000CFE90DD|nr:hypothetical protein [Erwinia billingiae]PRB59522.1 hypothetical protein CQ001_12000 [Erwinia billingiae]QEW30807.1 hypothetical protein D0N50_03500 [Erwinia billingiae]